MTPDCAEVIAIVVWINIVIDIILVAVFKAGLAYGRSHPETSTTAPNSVG